jgi:putative zinc finger/helix-turn-helix YgiT family protein
MLKRCPNCRGRIEPRRVPRERRIGGRRFTAELPAGACTACGERFVDDAVVGEFDLRIAARLAEAGVSGGAALRFMRKVTGLQGKEFAELLAVRPETVSRWERGRRPIDRATYAILRQLILDRTDRRTTTNDYLRSLCKPPRLPKTVRITVQAAAA